MLIEEEGVDVVLDGPSGSGFSQLVRAFNPGARIVFYGRTAGKFDVLSPQPIFWKQISIIGSTMGSDTDFNAMIEFVNLHKIRPVIDTVLPFDSIPEGFVRMEKGTQFGKIVYHH